MHVVICDDNVADLCSIKQSLLLYSEEKNMHFKVSAFNSAKELLDVLEGENDFDLLILDVVMPTMSGIDLGTALRKSGNDIDIIYTTTIKDYAFEAFKIKARDFLLKPVEDDLLFKALDLFFEEKEKSFDVVLTSKDDVCSVKFSDIVYCKAHSSGVVWNLGNSRALLVKEKMEDVFVKLAPGGSFYKLGNSCVINFDFVDIISNTDIILKTGVKIVIPKKKVDDVKQSYLSYQMLRG